MNKFLKPILFVFLFSFSVNCGDGGTMFHHGDLPETSESDPIVNSTESVCEESPITETKPDSKPSEKNPKKTPGCEHSELFEVIPESVGNFMRVNLSALFESDLYQDLSSEEQDKATSLLDEINATLGFIINEDLEVENFDDFIFTVSDSMSKADESLAGILQLDQEVTLEIEVGDSFNSNGHDVEVTKISTLADGSSFIEMTEDHEFEDRYVSCILKDKTILICGPNKLKQYTMYLNGEVPFKNIQETERFKSYETEDRCAIVSGILKTDFKKDDEQRTVDYNDQDLKDLKDGSMEERRRKAAEAVARGSSSKVGFITYSATVHDVTMPTSGEERAYLKLAGKYHPDFESGDWDVRISLETNLDFFIEAISRAFNSDRKSDEMKAEKEFVETDGGAFGEK